MRRYIDADVLLNTVFEVHCKECDKRKGEKNGKYKTIYEVGEAPCKSCGVNDMREYIEDAPTADVVEVVRCKDCKHYKIDHPRANGYHCCYRMHSIFPMKPDDFCSYGERREDE